MPVALEDITRYLNDYLRVTEVNDSKEALNGLQVEHDRLITRCAAAVDACSATIEKAAADGAELLFVHHGLFWSGLEPITGRHGRRVRSLVENGIALYSAHIPLDLHPELGNNALIADGLGLTDREWFGDYMGERLGVAGPLTCSVKELVATLGDLVGTAPYVMAHGPDCVSRVGIISGGGAGMIEQAKEADVDTFITGEGKHHNYFDAEEWGMNVIFAGHYATETLGIKALAAHVSDKYSLPWSFIDHPTGL